MACHPPHDHDGACETCQSTDEWVDLHRDDTDPQTTTMPPLRGDGGEKP